MSVTVLCKYTIDDIGIIFEDGSTATILSNNISSIFIEKDYHENFLPIMAINTTINPKLQAKIRQNHATVKCKVKINRFLVRNNQDMGNKKFLKPYIDDVFNLNIDDISPIRESLDDKMTGYDQSPQKDSTNLTLYLFKQVHIDKNKQPLNFILNNATIAETFVYGCTEVGIDKLLLSDPDNSTIYPQIIIPANTLQGMTEYLQNVYGIFSKGYMLFHDFDILYFINRYLRCTAYRPGEMRRVYIHVSEKDTPEYTDLGGWEDTNANTYHFNTNAKPSITSKAKEIQDTLFDTLQVVNTYTGKVNRYKLNLPIKNTNSVHTLDDRYDNPMAIEAFKYSLEETNCIVDIALIEPDLGLLTPNKEFYLDMKFKNTIYNQYNKIYKLHKFTAMFQRTSGSEYLSCNAVCQLKSD